MKTVTAKTAVVTAAITFAWPVASALPAFGDDRSQSSSGFAQTTMAPTAFALRSVPSAYLNWYQRAAHTCRGLSWPVLAGIGEMESGHGQSTAPGVHSSSNYAGAQGPMQFEPATFAAYAVRADTRHPLSVYNPQDAIFSAARMLCANGAASGTAGGLQSALLSYNHAGWYPPAVLGWAARYGVAAPAQTIAKPVPAKVSGREHKPATHPAPVHVAPSAATGTGSASTSREAAKLAAEHSQLAAQARILATEQARLSALAKQLIAQEQQLATEQQFVAKGLAKLSAARPSSASSADAAPAQAAPGSAAPVQAAPAASAPSSAPQLAPGE